MSFRPSLPEPLHMRYPLNIHPMEVVPILPYVPLTEEEEEDKRRRNQARLAHRLKRTTAWRLLADQDQSKTANVPMSASAEARNLCRARCLMRESMYPKPENRWVLQLPDVVLVLPRTGEISTRGTLEARGSGFIFTIPGLCVQFKDTSVKRAFLRRGDDTMPPLLQFHLNQPIRVLTEETMDFQFRLVAPERSDAYSTSYMDRNKDLANFVGSLDGVRWDSECMSPLFEELNKCEHHGVLPSGASVVFALTMFSLVVLVEAPFVAVSLKDIEIVNLSKAGSDGKFDMTVVFQDFKRDVLQINSIPLDSLGRIQHQLDVRDVKYYCNSKKLDWNSILKGIVKCPKRFVDSGGWESLGLEDELTLSYYGAVEDVRAEEWQYGEWS